MSEVYPYNYPGYPTGLVYPWKFPMPSDKERDRRWTAIRKAMTGHRLDCLILGGPNGYMNFPNNNVYYVSNYVPFFNPGTYIVFPRDGEPQLGVSLGIGPQFVHVASETSWIREIVGNLNPAQDIVNKVHRLGIEKGRAGIVGYKTGVFPASTNDILRQALPGLFFEDATGVLAEAMNEVTRTSEEEPALLRESCGIQDLSFQAVAKALKPGVTEKELWAISEEAIIKNGGWQHHFMLATSGPRPIFPRAPASHRELGDGDIIIFETNVVYGGVLSQHCPALSLGTPEKKTGEMFAFCEELYRFSLEELEKKRNYGDIEADLVKRIHGAGYEPMTPQIHIFNMSGEMPQDSAPQPGDYFTVHPNFCSRDYTRGAKFGDTVRIGKGGKVERLQKTPAKLNIVAI